MRLRIIETALLVTIVFGSACNKDDQMNNNSCFEDAVTIRQVSNELATIKKLGGQFYIVEDSTIDTRLNPCQLDAEFQIEDLPVTISGEVKETPQQVVCCTDNFVITKISR